jgi:hypothetical protein
MLAALEPRSLPDSCGVREAVALLDLACDWAAALGALAIAEGWDTGRLAYPDEGENPFESEVAGILAHRRGRAREQVEAARGRLAEICRRRATAEVAIAPAHSPLELLACEFRLSPLARDLVLLVAAPLLRGELARLYGILANDRSRPLCDELLLHQLLGADAETRVRISRELDREGPLVRYGLISRAEQGTRPFVALRVDPVLLGRLRGDDTDGLTTEHARVHRATVPPERLSAPRQVVEGCLQALAAPMAGGHLRLLVRGPEGSGRRTLLAGLAERAGRRLTIIDLATFPRDPAELLHHLQVELRRALLLGRLPALSGFSARVGDDLDLRERLRQRIAAHPGPIVFRLGVDERPGIDPGWHEVVLPRLPERERVEVCAARFAEVERTLTSPEEIAARYRVGPGVIARVAAQVAARLPADTAPAAVQAEAHRAFKQHLDVRLGTVAKQVTQLPTWDEVVLPGDVADTVHELVSRVRHHGTVFGAWGYGHAVRSARGVTALFEGGPGTGKTLIAGLVARELGLDLYRIDLSRILSKWIGETERNLADVFDAAEDGQVILLFDEADTLFAKRTEVRTSTDRYANAEVNFLLTRLDSFEGIALLTSNLESSIDPAFKRRLSVRLRFPFPDEEQRARLWSIHLPPTLPLQGTIDVDDLAQRYPLSGGYIRNICLRASFVAAERGVAVSQELLESAVRQEYRDLGRIGEGGALE